MTASAAAGALQSRNRVIAVVAAVLGLAAGIAAASVTFGSPVGVALLVAAAVAVTVWIAPWTSVVAMVLIGTVIEQFSLVSEGTLSDGTDRIPLFASFNAMGLGGIYASPYECFLALVIGVWLIKAFATRQLRLPASAIGLSVGAFGLFVAFGWIRGVVGGGSFQPALLELRPWLYLTIAFVASSQLIKDRRQLMVVIGAAMAGIAIKGLQGVLTLAIHFTQRQPQSILAHEESFFFGLFIALLAGLWLVPVKGRLRQFMTAAFPLVLVADIANQRRTAWAIAAVALVTVFVICFCALPKRRNVAAVLAVVGVVMGAVYWIGFSNDPGLLGQPARALLSQLSPSSRDQASNQYRVIEDVNLGIGIRNSMPLGTGFGHPIPQTVPNVDISNIDSFISYLPHDGVLYVWLRLGILGMLAFWLMVGVALMTGVDSFRRQPNRVTVVISLALVAAVMSYIVQGYYDMGLYWFRIAILMGCLMGAMDAARRFDANDRTKTERLQDRHLVGVKPGKRDLESAA